MINLCELAEQQKNQRAEIIKKRILRQTHDIKLAESLSPITKKLDEVNKSFSESNKQLVKKSEVEDGNTRTKHTENTNISRSLLDTLGFMKTSKNFFKLMEDDGRVYWNEVLIEPLGTKEFVIKIVDMIYILIFKHTLLIQNSLLKYWIILKKKQYLTYFKTLASMKIYQK